MLSPENCVTVGRGFSISTGIGIFGGIAALLDLDTPIEMDPETGIYSTLVPRSPLHMFFRVVGSDSTIECSECSGGSGG